MAGRGRGVAAFSFNVEALGLSRGCMPETRMGPNPLFPTTEFKPLALKAGEDEDYMLALKQEMRGVMKRLPHNIKPPAERAGVERYKLRYQKQGQGSDDEWTPDWNLFPKELKPLKNKPRTKPDICHDDDAPEYCKSAYSTVTKKKSTNVSSADKEAVLTKLNELEKKGDGNDEKSDEEKEKEKKKEGEEDEDVEEEVEEEELEEENDYIDNYFDNGEDFGAGSDENIDGEATY